MRSRTATTYPAAIFCLLAAAAWVAMHHAHGNLAGLEGAIEGRALSLDAEGPVEWHVRLRAPAGQWRLDIELDGPARASSLDANDQLRSPQEYERVVLAYVRGNPLRLGDEIGRAHV